MIYKIICAFLYRLFIEMASIEKHKTIKKDAEYRGIFWLFNKKVFSSTTTITRACNVARLGQQGQTTFHHLAVFSLWNSEQGSDLRPID